jgi:hypothetical protein
MDESANNRCVPRYRWASLSKWRRAEDSLGPARTRCATKQKNPLVADHGALFRNETGEGFGEVHHRDCAQAILNRLVHANRRCTVRFKPHGRQETQSQSIFHESQIARDGLMPPSPDLHKNLVDLLVDIL